MTYEQIKSIPITHYLKSKGIYPIKKYSGYAMYKSPFRDEETASFKVDYNRNLWYDFGSGEGGSIIDLVMKLLNCSINQAINQLISLADKQSFHQMVNQSDNQTGNQDSFFFHRDTLKRSGIITTDNKPLSHPKLLDYLTARKIDLDMAQLHCREIHYTINGRKYYAIGFANSAGGYELRNSLFKGCIVPKDLTHLRQDEKGVSCFVFEGFMDFLSLLTIRKQLHPHLPNTSRHDSIILNSATNLQKALPLLANYELIHVFPDNDKTGKNVLKVLQKELGNRVRDESHRYSNHKDLNEYLCSGEHLKHNLYSKKRINQRKSRLKI